MQELFRFSVVRAVTKAPSVNTSLAERPPAVVVAQIAKLQPTLQQSLLQIVKAMTAAGAVDNETVWARLEPIAAQFAITAGPGIISNPLWNDLGGFLSDLAVLTDQAYKPNLSAAAITNVFNTHPALVANNLHAYSADLVNLFIALMIIRRGGPTSLQTLSAQNILYQNNMVLLGAEPGLDDVAQRIGASSLATATPAPLAPLQGQSDAAARQALISAVSKATDATLIVPAGLFTPLRKPILGVGFRELHVVKQHIRRYELAEIGRIENILAGETRDHIQIHSLSTKTTTSTSESTTTETDKELTSTDHTAIKTEADSQVNTDTKLDAGVHAQYSGPSFKIQADLNVSYDKSDQETKKYSAETAKDVTQKAVSKVTEQVTRSQVTTIIEKFKELERQKFTNAKTTNIAGIYQWVEKVYLSQVFNLGRHMLIDITVPEPGANLLALATTSSSLNAPPIQPHPLGTLIQDANGKPLLDRYGRMQLLTPLNPLDLAKDAINPATNQADPNFYGIWVARYAATSVDPPPDQTKTFSTAVSFDYEDNTDKSRSAQIQVDDGFQGTTLMVSVSAMRNDDHIDTSRPMSQECYVSVSAGGTSLMLPWKNPGQRSDTLVNKTGVNPGVTGDVSVYVYAHNIDQLVVNVELVGTSLPTVLDKWKLQTFEKIADAYHTLQQTYDAAIAAIGMVTKTVGPLGAEDPMENRLTERVELKRSSIAIFDNKNETVRGTITPVTLYPPTPLPPPAVTPAALQPNPPDNPQLPELNVDLSQHLGARVRWFEQAFEWENMAYVLYPYFWGRRETWIPALILKNDDPLFVQFLQAGYARVVLPVRLGFESAVHFYLHTGLPWLGGKIPKVGDKTQNPLYLDVAEEIKALTDGGEPNEIEIPVGDPWEYTLPTTMLKLKDDDQMPEWDRVIPAGATGGQWSSDEPDGPWTWRDKNLATVGAKKKRRVKKKSA